MTVFAFFSRLRIRHKLLVGYSLVFMVIIGLGSLTTYSLLRQSVETNIESELKNSTQAILNLVRTSVAISIKHHLRATAEKNLEMVHHFHQRFERGELSEAEARRRAAALLLSQKIGASGYIACVTSQGIMAIHPKKEYVGADISHHAFVQEMIRKKKGYIEYQWKNPGEPESRPKALYMTYFEPWDWIINVSSYRKEFRTLVNVDDFRDSVLSFHFGKTGYCFVTDTLGNLVIHPVLEGLNIQQQQYMPKAPLQTMLAQKSGKIVYVWKNPGESRARKKLVIFNYIPEYEWIVASSSYFSELYDPLSILGRVILITLMTSLLLILAMTYWISASITKPLHKLIEHINRDTTGSAVVTDSPETADEAEQLTHHFNAYIRRLDEYGMNLQAEIDEHKETEEALRISQERYRSVMQAAPDPIIVYDMQGCVTYINSAFTQVFGWTEAECLGRKLDHFVPSENWEETRQGLATITSGQALASVETRRQTRSGRIIDVSVRGAVYRNKQGELMGSVIIHRDITDLKQLEKQVMDIGDKERQRIGQDLHDDLCPHLIGIQGFSKVLTAKIGEKRDSEFNLSDKITALIKEAITKTRHLARGLCPVYLVDHGLEFSLRELAANTESLFGVTCRLHCRQPVLIRDNTVATHLFRIVQEAVNNSVRHGRADRIDIDLGVANGRIEVSIADNGLGLPATVPAGGMGLRIMAFRAKMIDANLDIDNGKSNGAIVRITINAEAEAPPEDND